MLTATLATLAFATLAFATRNAWRKDASRASIEAAVMAYAVASLLASRLTGQSVNLDNTVTAVTSIIMLTLGTALAIRHIK